MGVTYTAPVTDTYATIKGLAKITDDTETTDVNEAVKAVTEGITVSGTTLTITDPALLTTSNVTVTAGKGHDAYTLAIGSGIPVKQTDKSTYWDLGATSYFRRAYPAYYELSNGTIKYNKPIEIETLATVKGLSKNVTASDIETTTVGDGSTVGVIKISANALDSKDVSLGAKDNYTLEFDSDVDPLNFVGDWKLTTSNKGVTGAVFEGSVGTLTNGYRLSADGKTAIYIATPKNETLVTITGTLNPNAEESDFEFINDDSGKSGVIVVKANALGTSNVTVKEKGYSLTFAEGDDAPYTDESSDVANGIDVWRVSGTTATYKKVIPAYYTINDKGVIVYHKETDVKGETYATIKGLSKDALAANFGKTNADKIDGIELNETTGVITISDEELLAKTNVVLTPAKDSGYTIALSSDLAEAKAVKPDDSDAKWSVSGTTATYKGKAGEGWVKTNDTTITYSKENSNAVLATVKGLAKGLKADSNGDIEGIEVSNKTITLSKDVLSTTDVTVEGIGGYKLALDEDLQGDGETTSVTTNKPSWDISGSTANYRNYTSPGFTVADDGATLKYSESKFGDSLFILTGLKSGIETTI